jgi:hypothetical protein
LLYKPGGGRDLAEFAFIAAELRKSATAFLTPNGSAHVYRRFSPSKRQRDNSLVAHNGQRDLPFHPQAAAVEAPS